VSVEKNVLSGARKIEKREQVWLLLTLQFSWHMLLVTNKNIRHLLALYNLALYFPLSYIALAWHVDLESLEQNSSISRSKSL